MRIRIRHAMIGVALIASSSTAVAADNNTQITNPGSSGDTQHVGNEPPSSAAATNGEATGGPAGPIGASGDTMPAKFSARNAADDKLPLGAYRLKHLTDAERQAIYRSVRAAAAPTAGSGDVHPDVGDLVPSAVVLQSLPGDVTTTIPDTRDLKFVTAHDKVVLVDPVNMMVVAVLGE